MSRMVPSLILSIIDRAFPWAKQADVTTELLNIMGADTIAGIVKLLDQISDELLSIEPREFADFILARESLRHASATFVSGTKATHPWPRPGDRNALCFIKHVLNGCPDEAPVAGTNELAFIEDEELRRALRLDLGAVESSLRNGEWKSATILAGSLVEAFLLWAIGQHDQYEITATIKRIAGKSRRQPEPSDLESWDLIHYIEVARELNRITDETASQARIAKDFRNLIHPGRERRRKMRCDRGTARSAAAAVDHVLRDLMAQPSRQGSTHQE
ncbi:hypothetical protein [Candidatus Binatus soli]|jgi:HEPN domain-containing protein|uniref:hypothetical protein n=1 Tax=Candidatus Binatus soli TaxID=1953413 RepID=UPI003D1247F3